jgi:hypothetical protein
MATKKKDELTDHEIKHLEFIQGVINRMGSNSFQMKGWMVVIVSALLAIYADNNAKNGLYVLFAILPTLIFWGLDSYYLQQERKFRGIYKDVAGLSKEPNKKKVLLFEMPIQNYEGGDYSFWNVFFSKTIRWLYAPVIGILLVIYFFLTP